MGEEFTIKADLVLIAAGFTNPEKELIEKFSLDTDERGNVKTDGNYNTSKENIFSAGDMRRGQSLIVWAIYEGREAALAMHKYLKKFK